MKNSINTAPSPELELILPLDHVYKKVKGNEKVGGQSRATSTPNATECVAKTKGPKITGLDQGSVLQTPRLIWEDGYVLTVGSNYFYFYFFAVMVSNKQKSQYQCSC